MRGIDLEVGFTLNRQSNMATPVAVARIDKKLPFDTFGVTTKEFPNAISDADWYGKGDSFASFFDPVTSRIVIPQRQYSATALSVAHALGFVLGQASTAAGITTLTFIDPDVTPEARYTSFLEKMGGVGTNLISGAVIEQATLSGSLTDHVKLAWSGFAREAASSAAALPAQTSAMSAFFKTLCATFNFDGADITGRVINWSIQFNQNPAQWWLPGDSCNTLLKKAMIGKQRVSGSISFLFEDTVQQNLFRTSDLIEPLTITLAGTDGTSQIVITIPHFKISAESFSEEQDQVVYTLTFSDQTVLKKGADPYVSVAIKTPDDLSTLLVVA